MKNKVEPCCHIPNDELCSSRDMKQFADMRARYRSENKSSSLKNEDSSSDDDEWLDDEQWYCEHIAQWTKVHSRDGTKGSVRKEDILDTSGIIIKPN